MVRSCSLVVVMGDDLRRRWGAGSCSLVELLSLWRGGVGGRICDGWAGLLVGSVVCMTDADPLEFRKDAVDNRYMVVPTVYC